VTTPPIEAVVFDCYGTLIDFDDAGFERAYGIICEKQGLAVTGKQVFDKWMEVWRRSVDSSEVAAAVENEPGPLSAEPDIQPRVLRHSGGWTRSLDGTPPSFHRYRDEWPEHFEIVFEELGADGDAEVASEHLCELLASAPLYPDVRPALETLSKRTTIAAMSNADNDFLLPCLKRNNLSFPVIVTSEDVRAYKPHVAIFKAVADAIDLPLTNILYVGDSRTADVIGAKHAGMYSAWVNRRGVPYHPKDGEARQYEPDFEIASLLELSGILDAS